MKAFTPESRVLPHVGQEYTVYHLTPVQKPAPNSMLKCFPSIWVYPAENPAPALSPSSVLRDMIPPILYS